MDTPAVSVVNPEDVSVRAAMCFNQQLSMYLDVPVLLLTSGGSAADIFRDVVDPTLIGVHTTIGLLDERIGPPEIRNRQNPSLVQFLSTCSGYQFMEIEQNVTHKASGQKFDRTLKKWKRDHPDGKIIIVQGIGEDGHTAGIMPFPENPKEFRTLFEGDTFAVGYDAGKKNKYPYRVTVTNTFLRSFVDVSIVYVCGRNKADALRSVLAPHGETSSTPARIIREMKSVFLFTDQQVVQ